MTSHVVRSTPVRKRERAAALVPLLCYPRLTVRAAGRSRRTAVEPTDIEEILDFSPSRSHGGWPGGLRHLHLARRTDG
jgi:hypothetical protein